MAIREVWIGSSGPQLYDDTEDYAGDPGEKQKALRSDGKVSYAAGENDEEGVIVSQLNSSRALAKAYSWFLS